MREVRRQLFAAQIDRRHKTIGDAAVAMISVLYSADYVFLRKAD